MMPSPPMPALVDPPIFIPPPHGAANGGQPGVYGGDPSSSNWPAPMHGTPYPTWPMSPAPPTSASSWTYGAHPWAPPNSAHQPSPAWGPPASAWGAYTPGGTWSSASPAASWGPQTPAAYSPWVPPQQQQKQGGTWITPNMHKPPSSPYDLPERQPVTGIWSGDGAIGYSGYPEGWVSGSKSSTPKKKKRHHSNHDDLPKRPPLYRSTSWGDHASKGSPIYPAVPPVNLPSYAKGDVFDERNLARRPLDWRPDYKPRLTSFLSKNRTEVADYVDPIKRSLHPLLLFAQSDPPIYQNLLEILFHSSSVEFLNLRRPHNDIDLAQLACQPSGPFLRLFHPRLPWYIDVYQVHPNGTTVRDVIQQIHHQLHTQIHPRHFYNEELTDSDRAEVTKAFQSRCRNNPTLISRGVLQIDYLGDKVIFEGLFRGPKGLWELKLARGRF